MLKNIGFKMTEENTNLLKKVCAARCEDVSNFIRRAILTELAKLGYCTDEQKKALGLNGGEK